LSLAGSISNRWMSGFPADSKTLAKRTVFMKNDTQNRL
jgi:hypothetical protein